MEAKKNSILVDDIINACNVYILQRKNIPSKKYSKIIHIKAKLYNPKYELYIVFHIFAFNITNGCGVYLIYQKNDYYVFF